MKIIFTLLYICLIANLEGMKQSMPFRIGFEFQMHGELCKWALKNYSIQKSPIYEIGVNGKKLFHIELDGPDIEFVTVPFSSYALEEKEHMKICMKFIVNMTELLIKLTNNPNRNTTIAQWFIESQKIDGIWMRSYEIFSRIKKGIIEKPTIDWQPEWQPQVTVQHPLQSTINLVDNLFDGTIIQQSIQEAKPFYNPVSNEAKPLYDTAIGGLIFLLASEICGINKSTVYQPNEVFRLLMKGKYVRAGDTIPDLDMISDTLESFETVHQFDAKRRTLFMSRRPFSHMLSDILKQKSIFTSDKLSLESLNLGFAQLFKQAMKENRFYKTCETLSGKQQRIEVSQSFWRANYAEQFFDKEGTPLVLTELLDYFDEETKILPSLKKLLDNGILSTAMFRHLNLTRLANEKIMSEKLVNLIRNTQIHSYYDTILNSFDKPGIKYFLNITKEDKIRMDLSNLIVNEQPLISDLFSPLFPLDEKDAMGFFREKEDNFYLQQNFGSAIIEIRAIQYVNFLLNKSNDRPAGFLTDPNYIESEAVNLYNWLSSLTIKHD